MEAVTAPLPPPPHFTHATGFPSNFSVDFSRTHLMAHSSGNHIVAEYLKDDCAESTRGWILVREGGTYWLVDKLTFPKQ